MESEGVCRKFESQLLMNCSLVSSHDDLLMTGIARTAANINVIIDLVTGLWLQLCGFVDLLLFDTAAPETNGSCSGVDVAK